MDRVEKAIDMVEGAITFHGPKSRIEITKTIKPAARLNGWYQADTLLIVLQDMGFEVNLTKKE